MSSHASPVSRSAIEDKIFELLMQRKQGATICPSEVARALLPEGEQWHELMPRIRQVAQGLARDHRISVTRGGVDVDAMSRGGPIRLGRPIKKRTDQDDQSLA